MKAPQDINEVPRSVLEQVEASQLPTVTLVKELQGRGFIVKDNTEYHEATGLLKWKGDGEYYLHPKSRKIVEPSEAYERASGGW